MLFWVQCSTLTVARLPMLWKIPLGYGILESCSPHGHWNFSVFSILLKYMAMTKFNRATDLQIQIAQMAVLKNIQSCTLWVGSVALLNIFSKHLKAPAKTEAIFSVIDILLSKTCGHLIEIWPPCCHQSRSWWDMSTLMPQGDQEQEEGKWQGVAGIR